jgi:hypothetical protein
VKERIPALFRERDSWAACVNLRPLCLSLWLQGRKTVCYKIRAEEFPHDERRKTS